MKKLFIAVLALVCLGAFATSADAQLALRGGGGMIFEGSQLGGHASLILPFSSKPAGVMIAAEYYKKSGVTTVPVSARGLYRAPVGEHSFYLGIGSGLIYSKNDNTGAIDPSSAKILFSGVLGLNLKFSGPLGAFGEEGQTKL